MSFLEQFHFIRPLWLLVLVLMPVFWWLGRRSLNRDDTTRYDGFAPHLVDALRVRRGNARGPVPIDLSVAIISLLAIAAAGPTYEREPNPLLSEKASVVIALAVTDTMLANDVQPTRLERARHKILDLIDRRGDGRTALIAYAGSAHLVLPPTEDARIIRSFLESLTPGIMPLPGRNATDALEMAVNLLEGEPIPGTVLFVSDGFEAIDSPAFEAIGSKDNAPGLLGLVIGTPEGGTARYPDGSLVLGGGGAALDTRVDGALLSRFANASGIRLSHYSVDDADIAEITGRISRQLQAAINRDETTQWKDLGWWLSLPLCLMVLYSFRRGWTMPWSVVLTAGLLHAPLDAEAAPLDWFVSADQQGRFAFERREYARAADLFVDPMWRGIAAYRAGRYADAVAAFSRVRTAQGFFNLGNAYIKNRQYELAIGAFEQAVLMAPQSEAAQRNLEVSRYIASYLIETRLASDTGDETELGADGFVFDNKSDEGTEITITDESRLEAKSADQWLRAVDTDTADFLRTKFLLELSLEAQ